jgi:hypothetical protein
MNDLLSKIETFLFDIIGLALPGIFLILLIIVPIYFVNVDTINAESLQKSLFLSFICYINTSLYAIIKTNPTYLITGLFIVGYILGHLIKVLSIILYDTLAAIFDDNINVAAKSIFIKIKAFAGSIYRRVFTNGFSGTVIYRHLDLLFKPANKYLLSIFIFRPPNYNLDNETLKSDVIAKINEKLGTTFPDKWYSLYKISVILNTQEGIKSLSNFFLSKYNLYRSLSLIFLFLFFYINFFFSQYNTVLGADLIKLKMLILLAISLLWYTFHYKYKRYWTLCGNETLVSIYYYLNKGSL